MSTFKPAPYVLVSTNHGTMIVNRNDFHEPEPGMGFGVGYQIFATSSFDQQEIDFTRELLKRRRSFSGDGVVAVDCGANIGVHTIEWARLMYQWGEVISFEPQEKIYYALAGNIAINNCFNVTAKLAAVGAECGTINIPEPNYMTPGSYGSLELRSKPGNEFIGQPVDYGKTKPVPVVTIDSLQLPRLDFLKIDTEGMELEVLNGAAESIAGSRPILLIEIIKSNRVQIEGFLQKQGYQWLSIGINFLAVHNEDPIVSMIKFENGVVWLG
jgi:FkbM family methyltransferase